MFVKTMPLGVCSANCYIVSGDMKHCAVIDPADDGKKIAEEIKKNGLELSAVLLTHCHYDHIAGLPSLLEHAKQADIYVHSAEKAYLTDTTLNLSPMFGELFTYTGVTHTFSDGDTIAIPGLEFSAMHTPGHTLGSTCFFAEKSIFSGDTLFALTIGRTDFPSGSYSEILKSLKKLKNLDENYTVYPGHNASTTLDYEKKYNEYLQL